jgi:uncharacterized protein (TIRG00374 family)
VSRLLRHLSQILPGLLALALGAYVLRSADLAQVMTLAGSLGWRLPLLLLPHLAVTLLEAVAWWRSFEALGGRPRFLPLVGTRLVAEAVMLGLPSGALISESLQPYLLKRRCGVPFETAVVATVGRKFFVVVSHGVVLLLATLLTWPLLARISREAIGRPGLPWLLLAVAVFMIATFGVGIALGARSGVAERTRVGLGHVPGRRLASWLERNALRFQRTDEHMLTFFARERGALALPLLLYAGGWTLRGVEVLLFLRAVGVDVAFATALVLENALIAVRSAAVPVPAGLGVQDVGYVLFLKAIGVPAATTVGAAFVLLKRGKDLIYVLLGFALMAMAGGLGGATHPPEQ